jgi:hypothetical protein
LLRNRKLAGVKIGQLWLVDKGTLDIRLESVQNANDQRFGPKITKCSAHEIVVKQSTYFWSPTEKAQRT